MAADAALVVRSAAQGPRHVEIPQSQIKGHAVAATASSAPSSALVIRVGIDAPDDESLTAGRKVDAAEHVPLVHFEQQQVVAAVSRGNDTGIIAVTAVCSTSSSSSSNILTTTITTSSTNVRRNLPKMQPRPVGNRQQVARGMKGQTDDGILQAHHLQTHLFPPIPDSDLVPQTSRRDDIRVGRVVLDRPGGAGVPLEGLAEPTRGAAGDFDRVVAVRGGHGVSVRAEGDGNGADGATAGGAVAVRVQRVVAAEVGEKGGLVAGGGRVFGKGSDFAGDRHGVGDGAQIEIGGELVLEKGGGWGWWRQLLVLFNETIILGGIHGVGSRGFQQHGAG